MVKCSFFAMILRLPDLIDEKKACQILRELRWRYGCFCPFCNSNKIRKRGKNHRHQGCQRYECQKCERRFDDLTGTLFAKRHQSVTVWISQVYLMGLNVSNAQIAQELGLCQSDCQRMSETVRLDVVERKPQARLEKVVECDEVYIVAGHKGIPKAIKNRDPRRNRLKGARGRGTLETEKPPIFGMIQRDGQVSIQMLPNVQQSTIKPIIEQTVSKGTLIYTDEYAIYNRLEEWGYLHKTVNHSQCEYARDEDGDGFHEVHVNTMEGFWSLLRSWLRPHRGISQEKLPLYLGFFEFIHNVRKRGQALLEPLLSLLLQPKLCPQNAI
jgi:transposase-like protein